MVLVAVLLGVVVVSCLDRGHVHCRVSGRGCGVISVEVVVVIIFVVVVLMVL